MLKRLYVNNFRCLINFEITFQSLSLLMGENGAGKSAVFDVLSRICRFVHLLGDTEETFPWRDWPFWLRSGEFLQTFELELEGNGGRYLYHLCIEHDPDLGLNSMKTEKLFFNNSPLFEFSNRTAQLYQDDFSSGPHFSMEGSRSGVGWLGESHDNRRLVWFRERLRRLFLVRMNPALMGSESQKPTSLPSPDLADFASWYHHLLLSEPGFIYDLTGLLREILPGFRSLQLPKMGDRYRLTATFMGEGHTTGEIGFAELSDGQKCLIALYSLLGIMQSADFTLFLDEPENFLALPEVHAWLDAMDRQHDGNASRGQYLLISHHPWMINFLAKHHGLWLYRADKTGSSRARPIQIDPADDGLPVSVLVERGWIMEA